MITLFDSPQSGNCYKIRLLFGNLQIEHRRVEVPMTASGAITLEYKQRFPFGQVPVVQTDDGLYLAESAAILWAFAEGTSLMPEPSRERVRLLEWLLFEQTAHMPYLGRCRFWKRRGLAPELGELQRSIWLERGTSALLRLEDRLRAVPFLLGEHYSIGDIALYPYTSTAHEAGFDLQEFPSIRAWLARVATQRGYVRMLE